MRRFLILLTALCVLFSSAALAAAPDTVRIGDSRESVEQMMRENGITPYIDEDGVLAWETENCTAYYLLDDAGLVCFIDYSYIGGENTAADFTLPDWSLTCDALLASLAQENAWHEDFYSDESPCPTVYVTATFFGALADLALEFDENGLLAEVSVYAYEESVMDWAMRASAVLGLPESVNRFTEDVGICTNVKEDTAWVREDGSYYTLSSTVSFAAFMGETGVLGASDTEIELCVYAPAR